MCASLKKVPTTVQIQSTGDPPCAVGLYFAVDVLKRYKQLVMVLRECVTSYTCSCLIEDETKDTLCSALVRLCIETRPLGTGVTIRVDPAPGFTGLQCDDFLRLQGITLEIGRIKNVNKNPVAEHAIAELGEELLRYDPSARCVSPVALD